MKTNETLEQLVMYAKRMSEANLSLGTAGNLSARLDENTMAITPTGVPYHELQPQHMCIVNFRTGERREGQLKPSSETPMHAAVYAVRSDIEAIVHTHSLHATAFAAAGKPLEAVHYVIATIGDRIPLVPYRTYGSQALANAVAEVLQEGKGALLENHGVLALGDSLSEAYYHAEMIEYLAQLSFLTHAIGGAQVLASAELDRVREKFHGYGQG